MIYLDHNATTRPLPAVIEAMTSALAYTWGNPSSRHAAGQDAKRMLAAARADVAILVGAQAAEVVFTSGATEANHHVLQGALRPGLPRRIVLSAIEHGGYLKAALRLRQQGIDVLLLPVDAAGRVRVDALHDALREDAALVSVMAANNETGVLQPIDEISALTRARGIPLHVDATQLIGKLPFGFADSGADLLSLSAHKLHGPKGVGALVIRKGLNWPPLMVGQQERGRRGGTENMPGIVGFAAAARHAQAAMTMESTRQRALRDHLEQTLLAHVPGVTIHGGSAARLPNTLCLTLAGASADRVLDRLARADILASSGAACSSGGAEPSHVLRAMGVAAPVALGAVRLSLGLETQAEDVDRVATVLTECATSVATNLATHAPPAALANAS